MNRVLIDTQALVWLADDSRILSQTVFDLLDAPTTVRLASVASIWEMAIKIGKGLMTLREGDLQQFVDLVQLNDIELLPITLADAIDVLKLPRRDDHKDPFDRLIAAQCLRLDLTLVSIDKAFDAYGVRRVW